MRRRQTQENMHFEASAEKHVAGLKHEKTAPRAKRSTNQELASFLAILCGSTRGIPIAFNPQPL